MKSYRQTLINILVLVLLILNPLLGFVTSSVEAQFISNEKSATIDIHAKKVWKGGPEQKPDLWFLLMHEKDGVRTPVTDVLPKKITKANTEVIWYGMPKYDQEEKEIVYSVNEGIWDELHLKFTEQVPQGYVASKSFDGLTIWNTFIKEETPPDPTIGPILQPIKTEIPPTETAEPTEPPVITPDPTGPVLATPKPTDPPVETPKPTDPPVETPKPTDPPVETPDPTEPPVETPLPKSVTAKIVWAGGELPRPVFWLKLQQIDTDGVKTDVADVLPIRANFASQVTWANVPSFSEDFVYTIAIVDADGKDFTIPNYTSVINGLTLTNTWVEQDSDDVVAKVEWLSSLEPKELIDWAKLESEKAPTIWLRLYRQSNANEVPVALLSTELKELPDGLSTVSWSNLPKTNAKGDIYTYSVKQVDAEGKDFTPDGFKKIEAGLLVQNVRDQIDTEEPFEDADGIGYPVELGPVGIFYPGPQPFPGNHGLFSFPAEIDPGEVQLDKNATPVPGMLNTWDLSLEIRARDSIVTSDIVLVIDRSGSMNSEGRMAAAKSAAIQFVNTLLPDGNTTTRIALVSFGPNVTAHLGGNFQGPSGKSNLISAINGLSPSGGTFTQAAIRQATAIISGSTADRRQIVLLSDGEPTYSYQISDTWKLVESNLFEYEPRYFETTTSVPLGMFESGTAGTGGSMRTTYQTIGFGDNAKRYQYNHGNSAIIEAGVAKGGGSVLYTVALSAGTNGTSVLNAMASPGKAYNATPGELAAIFAAIAGEIAAAARNGSVSDPMGAGFTVLGNVSDIVVSQGTVSYDPATQHINWNVGNLTTPCATPPANPGNSIKCAKMTYRITIDDSILDIVPPPADGYYPTNDGATFSYTDEDGAPQTKNFPEPKVNPVFYTVSKVLKDAAGNIINPDTLSGRKFNIRISRTDTVSDPAFPKTIELVAGQTRLFTDLRYGGSYQVEEISVDGYPGASLSDYTITIIPQTFVVMANEDDDVPVIVTNQEKALGELTIAKRLYDINGEEILDEEFEFTVKCPDLPGEACPAPISNPYLIKSGAANDFTITGLPYGRYQVDETPVDDMNTISIPPLGQVILTAANKTGLVTYINNMNTSIGAGRIHKYWIGGPIDPPPSDVCFQVMGRVQGSGDPWAATPYLFRIDYSQGSWDEPTEPPHWHYESLQVPLSFRDGDGNIQYYEYMMLEGTCDDNGDGTYSNFVPYPTNAPPNYTSTQENESTRDWNTPAVYDITMWNTYQIPQNGSFTASKVWEGGPLPRPTLTFQLYRKTAINPVPVAHLDPIALDGISDGTSCSPTPCGYENPGWTVNWIGLDETDIDGNVYTYSFLESDISDEDYAATYPDANTVVNTYTPKTLRVVAIKEWFGGNVGEITFQLNRRVVGSTTVETIDLQTVTAADLWTFIWPDDSIGITLPVKNQDGIDYEYWVEEGHMDSGTFVRGVPGYLLDESSGCVEFGEDPDRTVQCVFKNIKKVNVSTEKIWAGGSDPRPTVYHALYQQIGSGTPQAMDGYIAILDGVVQDQNDCAATPTEACELTAWKGTWADLPSYTIDNEPIIYTTVEVIPATPPSTGYVPGTPDGYQLGPVICTDLQNGDRECKITNIKLSDVTAYKVWSGGPTPRPTVWFKLYRQISGGALEEVPVAEAPIKELADGTTSVIWNNLSETDDDGNPYTFSVKEVDATGNDFTPTGYTKSEQGLTVTNTYVIPKDGSATAYKVWSGGPSPRPTVWFKLYRQISGGALEEVPVAEAPIKELADGTTSVTWNNLSETDNDGNPYTFSVKEVDAAGNDFTPPGYTKSEQGLTVTNAYIIPKNGTVTAYKVWSGGPSPRPTVWFKLYRQISGGTLEEVPVAEAPIKELADGTTSVTWNNLSETDFDGNPYIFSVKEGIMNNDTPPVWEEGAPENYEASYSQDGLTVTNTYKSPTNDVTAYKIWMPEDLLDSLKVPVSFQLYRHIGNPDNAQAVGTAVTVSGPGWSYTWPSQPTHDNDGNLYTYFVIEDPVPNNFEASYSQDGLTVTNTYVPPTIEALIANKIWMPEDLLDSLKVPVSFQLWRYITDPATPEAVGAPVELNAAGGWQYTWPNMPATDADGNPYTYFVTEPVTPDGFDKLEEGMTVTNTYVPPTIEALIANKIWMPEDLLDSLKVPVTFQLWRYTTDPTTPEAVGAPVELNAAGGWQYTWPNMPATDADGNPYTYFVTEPVTPDGFEKIEEGMTVTNLYNTSTDVVTAEKVWVGGSSPRPTVYFQLWRSWVYRGTTYREPVPGAEIKALPDGTLTVIWTDIDTETLTGIPYTFSVKEVDAAGNDFTPPDYSKLEEGLKVTNTYVPPTVFDPLYINKIWEGGKAPYPAIYVQLYRNIPGGTPEAVGSPVQLDGVADSGCVNECEVEPWRAIFQDLPLTDGDGNPYTYTPRETDADGNDYTPEGYVKSYDGNTIINKYIIPKVDITATKVWKGGSGTRPTIRLQLYRNGVAFGSPVDLVHPNTTYTWKDLDKTDSYGQAYTYTVDEVTVPANYSKSVVGLTITNTYIEPPKDPKVPYTGDASNAMLYGMLALSSLAGFGAVTVAKRRKKN
jgi:uncharacterized protein YnzC (UPF0291/DUF896 family)